MTDVRLAFGGPVPSLVQALGHEWEKPPAILVSLVYLKDFLRRREQFRVRDWVLDSGAFSVKKSGKTVDLDFFIEVCQAAVEEHPDLVEIFALDVIGDWRASLQNCETMWKAGIQAIPCYHIGEPDHVLQHIAENYPKIALGGMALLRGPKKIQWAEQCFARVWPKKIHGFGVGSRKGVLAVPWHSVDASSWEFGPTKYGNWRSFGKLSVRREIDIRAEVAWHLELEQEAKQKWRTELTLLES